MITVLLVLESVIRKDFYFITVFNRFFKFNIFFSNTNSYLIVQWTEVEILHVILCDSKWHHRTQSYMNQPPITFYASMNCFLWSLYLHFCISIKLLNKAVEKTSLLSLLLWLLTCCYIYIKCRGKIVSAHYSEAIFPCLPI